METIFPDTDGYDGIFFVGKRGDGGNGVTEAGAVVVKRSYRVVSGGLQPDADGEPIVNGDRTRSQDNSDGVPYVQVTTESDLVPRKHFGDLIVLGANSGDSGGRVEVDGALRLRRNAATATLDDQDTRDNLFGWQPRTTATRRNDARPVTGGAAASDRLDRFYNAQRRTGGGFLNSVQDALPASGAFELRLWRKPDPDADEDPAWQADFAAPALRARLYVHAGRCPDRDTRWCATDLGTLALDTLVLRPDADTVSAVWRVSWPWRDHPADSYRRVIVAEDT